MPLNVVKLAAGLPEWGCSALAQIAGSKISVVRMAESGSGFDIHQHDEAILVVEGKITLEVQSELTELGPGDFMTIRAGQSHRVVSSLGGTLMLFEH